MKTTTLGDGISNAIVAQASFGRLPEANRVLGLSSEKLSKKQIERGDLNLFQMDRGR